MTIEETIKIGVGVVEGGQLITDSELRAFAKLGIEALKLIKQHPTIRFFLDGKLLPGETEE